MSEPLKFLLVLAAWFVTMRWILPSLGIGTCMSGACQPHRKQEKSKSD